MVFDGEWVMHSGVQAPVANRSWLVPGADSRRRWEFPAEFVENETTIGIIRNLGVDYAQGYFIGKPATMVLNG